MIDDMNRLEWIEINKPDIWFSKEMSVWVVYTVPIKRYEGRTLAEAIDKAIIDVEKT